MSKNMEKHECISLPGNWDQGFAYDIHTIHSEHYVDDYGNDRWNNTRSEMGELVYKLKYQKNKSATKKIVRLLKDISGIDSFDAIIPAPPSKQRSIQPVYEICRKLGKKVNVPVYYDVLKKNSASELKAIDDPKKRKKLLKKSMKISAKHNLEGKKILLIDDLYRSGSTLKSATKLLYSKTKVETVSVLTMTKTRSKR